MDKRKAGITFLRCLPFGPVLGGAAFTVHLLITFILIQLIKFNAIYIFRSMNNETYFNYTVFFVGAGVVLAALPFSILLFLICHFHGLKPRLVKTLYYSLIGLIPLDLICNLLNRQFPDLVFHFFGVTVVLVFFGCLAVAIVTAEKLKEPQVDTNNRLQDH